MSDTGDRQGGAEPRRRDRTIAEESRAPWAPGHAEGQEAGDDGPHRTIEPAPGSGVAPPADDGPR